MKFDFCECASARLSRRTTPQVRARGARAVPGGDTDPFAAVHAAHRQATPRPLSVAAHTRAARCRAAPHGVLHVLPSLSAERAQKLQWTKNAAKSHVNKKRSVRARPAPRDTPYLCAARGPADGAGGSDIPRPGWRVESGSRGERHVRVVLSGQFLISPRCRDTAAIRPTDRIASDRARLELTPRPARPAPLLLLSNTADGKQAEGSGPVSAVSALLGPASARLGSACHACRGSTRSAARLGSARPMLHAPLSLPCPVSLP